MIDCGLERAPLPLEPQNEPEEPKDSCLRLGTESASICHSGFAAAHAKGMLSLSPLGPGIRFLDISSSCALSFCQKRCSLTEAVLRAEPPW